MKKMTKEEIPYKRSTEGNDRNRGMQKPDGDTRNRVPKRKG